MYTLNHETVNVLLGAHVTAPSGDHCRRCALIALFRRGVAVRQKFRTHIEQQIRLCSCLCILEVSFRRVGNVKVGWGGKSDSIPSRIRNFSLPHKVQNISRAWPAFYPMSNISKRAKGFQLLTQLHSVKRLRTTSISPLPHTLLFYGTWLKRDPTLPLSFYLGLLGLHHMFGIWDATCSIMPASV